MAPPTVRPLPRPDVTPPTNTDVTLLYAQGQKIGALPLNGTRLDAARSKTLLTLHVRDERAMHAWSQQTSTFPLILNQIHFLKTSWVYVALVQSCRVQHSKIMIQLLSIYIKNVFQFSSIHYNEVNCTESSFWYYIGSWGSTKRNLLQNQAL